MPGQLIHTNEIQVLLGDNWFVDRSAKQAAEIIDRRVAGQYNALFFFFHNFVQAPAMGHDMSFIKRLLITICFNISMHM